jgi:hypothetical protein
MAALSLFLALTGGTAVALSGSDTVFSDDIVDGEVKPQDIAPSSVGSNKAIDDSLQSIDVKDGDLTGIDFKNESLTGGDVRDETVNRRDYKEVYGFSARMKGLTGSNAGAQFGAVDGISTASDSPSTHGAPSPNPTPALTGEVRVYLKHAVAPDSYRSFNLQIGDAQGDLCNVEAGEQTCTVAVPRNYIVAPQIEWQLRTRAHGTPGPTEALVTFVIRQQ